MSHWAEAKLGLKCSLGVLQTALIGVMKQFNINISPSSIKIDPDGKLSANGYGGRNAKSGYNLVTNINEGHGIAVAGIIKLRETISDTLEWLSYQILEVDEDDQEDDDEEESDEL